MSELMEAVYTFYGDLISKELERDLRKQRAQAQYGTFPEGVHLSTRVNVSNKNCRNCGAPPSYSAKCEYCGTRR